MFVPPLEIHQAEGRHVLQQRLEHAHKQLDRVPSILLRGEVGSPTKGEDEEFRGALWTQRTDDHPLALREPRATYEVHLGK